jgi:hypothetical protein
MAETSVAAACSEGTFHHDHQDDMESGSAENCNADGCCC